MPQLLEESGFQGMILEILSTFCSGVGEIVKDLRTPTELTRETYEIEARLLLGFPAVTIFGTESVTPSMKQAVVFLPYYIEKAKKDGSLVGMDFTLRHFSDGLMETAHKRPNKIKQNNTI